MRIIHQEDRLVITGRDAAYGFDRATGALLYARLGGREHVFTGLYADAGVDGRYLRGQMAFDPLMDKRTWELPQIQAVNAPDAGVFMGFTEEDGALLARYEAGGALITQVYDLCGEALRLRARLYNTGAKPCVVNGLSFLLRRKADGARFEYPANDSRVYTDQGMADGQAHACGLVGSMTHIKDQAGSLNLLFLDEVEKWSQGAYRAGGCISHVYAAAVEAELQPGESLEAGCLYLSLPEAGEDPYLHIRGFFDRLGFRPLRGSLNEGLLYSCHPHGTMDGGFKLGLDLRQYAERLPQIRALGVDHIWLLPVFDHLDRGVYHPTDQRPIDARYGGEEAMRHFAQEAHALGMTVLFDYVPHGPEPADPLAQEHLDWCSRRLDGSLQDEWHCVSFDMTHPDYLDYTRELVGSHVRRFGIDGARIDCAMGGLSNWQPYGNHRPSASNLMGGVAISRAIMEGFERMGKRAFLLPENFNPVPAYYPVTGVFYGMNLYRVMTLLWERGVKPAEYVSELTRFLDIERRVTPEGLKKLRFLGNHDTVSWVWQKQRAWQSYGEGKARALFALMYFLDGVPMLYQGDEDPALAGKEGPDLRAYLTRLREERRRLTGEGTGISYLHTGSGVMAFRREMDGLRRLVLISLEDSEQTLALDELLGAKLEAGQAETDGTRVMLPPYAYAIFTLKG